MTGARRRSLQRSIALAATLVACGGATAAAATNPITTENAKAGDAAWQYPRANAGTMADQYAGVVRTIDGYTGADSVLPGGSLDLHVSSQGGRAYRVEVFRLGWYGGAGARRIVCLPSCTGSHPGTQQPAPPALDANGETAAGWPVTDTILVGDTWVSGYYIAQLVLTSGADAGSSRYVPFVVRPPAGNTAQVLVQVPANTWAAYNGWGGKSLYDEKSLGGIRANRVSFDRPYWASMYDLFDHDMQTVRFLESRGYDVVYATDRDVDHNPGLLSGRRLVIANGHDEYWTGRQRDAFDAARDGVSLAFRAQRWRCATRTTTAPSSGTSPPATPSPIPPPRRCSSGTWAGRSAASWACSTTTRGSWTVSARGGHGGPHAPVDGGHGSAGDTLAATVGYEWDLITPAPPRLTRLFTWSGARGLPNADSVPTPRRRAGAARPSTPKQIDAWRAYGAALGAPTPLQAFMGNMFDAMVSGSGASSRHAGGVVHARATPRRAGPSPPAPPHAPSPPGLGHRQQRGLHNGTDTTATVALPAGVHVRLRVTDDAGATPGVQRSVNGTVPPAVNLLATVVRDHPQP
ncbi:MAG: DUF6605 domain-containing protein [Thermoleophilia bacterium]